MNKYILFSVSTFHNLLPPNFHFPHYFTPKFPFSTLFYPLISTFHIIVPPNFQFSHPAKLLP